MAQISPRMNSSMSLVLPALPCALPPALSSGLEETLPLELSEGLLTVRLLILLMPLSPLRPPPPASPSIRRELIRLSAGRSLLLWLYSPESFFLRYIGFSELQGREKELIVIIVMVKSI